MGVRKEARASASVFEKIYFLRRTALRGRYRSLLMYRSLPARGVGL